MHAIPIAAIIGMRDLFFFLLDALGGDFDFLLEAACGVVAWTWGVADGGGARGGTIKLALQAGHSMVWPASSSGISNVDCSLNKEFSFLFSFQFCTRLAAVFS